MVKFLKKILYWAPRILTIFFAIFITLFAFDVFEEEKGFIEIILALLIHLIPIFVIIIVLIVSWKREWVGGIFYLLLAILYLLIFRGRANTNGYIFVTFLLIIIGILFLVYWFYKKRIKV